MLIKTPLVVEKYQIISKNNVMNWSTCVCFCACYHGPYKPWRPQKTMIMRSESNAVRPCNFYLTLHLINNNKQLYK